MNAGRKKAGMLAAMLTTAALVVAGCASADPDPNPLQQQDALGNPAATDSPNTNGDADTEGEATEGSSSEVEELPLGPDGTPIYEEELSEEQLEPRTDMSPEELRSDPNTYYFDVLPSSIDIHPQVHDFYDDSQIEKLMPNAMHFIDRGLSVDGLRNVPFDPENTPAAILTMADGYLTEEGMEKLEEFLSSYDEDIVGAYVLFPFLSRSGGYELENDDGTREYYTIDTSEDWTIVVSDIYSTVVVGDDNMAVVHYTIEIWKPLEDSANVLAQRTNAGLGLVYDSEADLWLVNDWSWNRSDMSIVSGG